MSLIVDISGMSKEIKIIFPSDQRRSLVNNDISNRLSRSMDSVESIVKHLEEYAVKVKSEAFTLRRISSSLTMDERRTKKERRSASLSHIEVSSVPVTVTEAPEVVQDQTQRRKEGPSNILLPSDQYIRHLDGTSWEVYRNQDGRIFYHDTSQHRSSWKPPRNLKPKLSLNVTEPLLSPAVSMVRDSIRIRELEDQGLQGVVI